MTDIQQKEAKASLSPLEVFGQMVAAEKRHDLDGMVECFSRDFISEQPFHPERNFVGQGGVRKNYGFFFRTIPDFQIDILSAVEDGDTVWSEVIFHGQGLDGKEHKTRGVTLTRVREGQIVWARLYIEDTPVPDSGGAR